MDSKRKRRRGRDENYGQITRPKIGLRASPLFLFISFSIWIILIIFMGETIPTHSQDVAKAPANVLTPQ
jgi:hypothetical protein